VSEPSEHGAIGCLSPDEELQQAVCAALIEAPELDSGSLAVRAESGKVVLTGSVRSQEAWHSALRIARQHAGADSVQADELQIDDG